MRRQDVSMSKKRAATMFLTTVLLACTGAMVAGMTTNTSLHSIGEETAAQSATSDQLILSKRDKRKKKRVTPSRKKAKGAKRQASKGGSRASVRIDDSDTDDSVDLSSDESQETTQELGPLGKYTILHDGKYDPATMEAFETLGVEYVHVIGQGEDPHAEETGWIDIELVISNLMSRNPGGIHGWLELDFERPFVPILREGITNPRFEEIRTLMRAFVVRVKRAFPDAKVTIYNVPALPWRVPQQDGTFVGWPAIDSEQRSAALEKLEDLKPLLDEFDWFLPRYYDYLPTSEMPESDRERVVPAEIDHRLAHSQWLRSYIDASDRPDRKILPVVRTRWVGGSSTYAEFHGLSIPRKEFLFEQVYPALDGGANGLFIWGGAENYALHIAFTQPGNWSEEILERTYNSFRRLGVLGPDEVPSWTSAIQKRKFQAALGACEAPYVASTASVMRERSRIDSDEEGTDQGTDGADSDESGASGSIATTGQLIKKKKKKNKTRSGSKRKKKAKSASRLTLSSNASK